MDDLTFSLVNDVEMPVSPTFKTVLAPNPARNEMLAQVPKGSGPVVLTLFDLSSRSLKTVSFRQQTAVNVSVYVPGEYFYEMRNTEGRLLDGGSFQVVR